MIKKSLFFSAVIFGTFLSIQSYADNNPKRNSSVISWRAFNDLANDFDTNINLNMDLYNDVLKSLSSDIYSEKPITLNVFQQTCIDIIQNTKTNYADIDCINLLTELREIHNKYLDKNNIEDCSKLVNANLSYLYYTPSSLSYISEETPAFVKYIDASKKYKKALTRLSNIDPSLRNSYTEECNIIKEEEHASLLEQLVEKNYFIQSLNGTTITLYYTEEPDYNRFLSDAKDQIVDTIGGDYINYNSIECMNHGTVHCEIEPVYGGGSPITIRMEKAFF